MYILILIIINKSIRMVINIITIKYFNDIKH